MPSVYLSPSTQEWNPYYSGGNEEYYMNILADYMEPYLISSGIRFARNDPEKNVQGAIRESNSGWYDAHLALHSNAGGDEYAGKLRGVDIYFSPYSKESGILANIIANNMQELYPLPGKSRALPTTSLGEVRETKAVAVLAELGYHDNPEDEAWLKANLESIAENLARSLADYFGIPFIHPQQMLEGVVVTDGSGLNVRAYPDREGRIIGSLPNGAKVTVVGTYNGWYVIHYGNLIGYSSGEFIQVGA